MVALIQQPRRCRSFDQEQGRDDQAGAHAMREMVADEVSHPHTPELRIGEDLNHPDQSGEHPGHGEMGGAKERHGEDA